MFDREFLLALDAGTDSVDPTSLVKSYAGQWWTGRNSPDSQNILNAENLEEYIRHHRSLTGQNHTEPNRISKTSYTWSRGALSANIACDKCRLYREVTMGVLDDLRDLRHHIHGLEVAQGAAADRTSRRAGAFHQLHEAAVLKELGSTSESHHKSSGKLKQAKRKGKDVQSVSEQVRVDAEATLAVLRDLPNVKWTSGSPLTHDEVFAALKPHPHSGRAHSGYVKSLRWGKCGEGSVEPMSPSPHTADIYTDISRYSIPPLSPDMFPHHFAYPPLRDYHGDPPAIGQPISSVPDRVPPHRDPLQGNPHYLHVPPPPPPPTSASVPALAIIPVPVPAPDNPSLGMSFILFSTLLFT